MFSCQRVFGTSWNDNVLVFVTIMDESLNVLLSSWVVDVWGALLAPVLPFPVLFFRYKISSTIAEGTVDSILCSSNVAGTGKGSTLSLPVDLIVLIVPSSILH